MTKATPADCIMHKLHDKAGVSNISKSASSGIAPFFIFLTTEISKSETCQTEVQIFMRSLEGCLLRRV